MRPRRKPLHPDDPEGQRVRHVTEGLGVITQRLGLAEPERIGAALTCWPDVVGPAIAAHSTPRSLGRGTLTVEVAGPEWTTELRYLEGDVLARLAERLGPDLVTAVRFVVPRR